MHIYSCLELVFGDHIDNTHCTLFHFAGGRVGEKSGDSGVPALTVDRGGEYGIASQQKLQKVHTCVVLKNTLGLAGVGLMEYAPAEQK